MEIGRRGLFMPMASVSGARSLVQNYAHPAIQMSAQFCRNTRILWVHRQRGCTSPQFTELGNNAPQIPAQYKFGSGVRFWQCLAHEISDPDLLVIQQLFDRIESRLGVFIALAIS